MDLKLFEECGSYAAALFPTTLQFDEITPSDRTVLKRSRSAGIREEQFLNTW